jgi:hypothetical protein
MIMNDKLGRVWKEVFVRLSQHLPRSAKENHKNLNQGSWLLGRSETRYQFLLPVVFYTLP